MSKVIFFTSLRLYDSPEDYTIHEVLKTLPGKRNGGKNAFIRQSILHYIKHLEDTGKIDLSKLKEQENYQTPAPVAKKIVPKQITPSSKPVEKSVPQMPSKPQKADKTEAERKQEQANLNALKANLMKTFSGN